MKVTESTYVIELSRMELRSLVTALQSLQCFCEKFPDERNGYNVVARDCVDAMRKELSEIVK